MYFCHIFCKIKPSRGVAAHVQIMYEGSEPPSVRRPHHLEVSRSLAYKARPEEESRWTYRFGFGLYL